MLLRVAAARPSSRTPGSNCGGHHLSLVGLGRVHISHQIASESSVRRVSTTDSTTRSRNLLLAVSRLPQRGTRCPGQQRMGLGVQATCGAVAGVEMLGDQLPVR